MIKFGASLRFYVVRCPDIEKNHQELTNLSNDMALLKEAAPKIQENTLKKQYIRLLRSFEATEYGIHRNVPQQKSENADAGGDGISWGIDDEEAVYSYQDEHELKLEPSVLRQLPGLNEKQLEKIEQFEMKMSKYQAIETEYEELSKKERKEFGLDEVSKSKKESLEKKIQETAQQLETLEETLKLMIFKEKTQKSWFFEYHCFYFITLSFIKKGK